MRCRPIVRRRRALGAGVFALAAIALAPRAARAQRPDAEWRTIATPHFRVHFEPAAEEVARRAAASAESAYVALARELVPPRGTIELVISDDVDFSNGYTTTFPTSRIVVYAQPPVDEPSLRNYSDWMALVVTHELTHVFHLDRSRGAWLALQRVFGRNPYLFPAAYEPRWMSEGIAVYYESRITGSGRIVGTAHRAIVRAAALGSRTPSLAGLSVSRTRFPGGESVYIYGSLLFDELAREKGPASVPAFIERNSHALPFMYNRVAKKEFGESFKDLLRAVRDSSFRGVQPATAATPLADWRPLVTGFDLVRAPRWRDGRIVFAGDPGRETAGAYEVTRDGVLHRIGRRVGAQPNVPLADGSLLTSQLEFSGPAEIRSDLYVQRGRRLHRLTHGQRLTAPDARADGEIVAVQGDPGTTVIARVSRDGRRVRPIVMASLDTQWAQPRWSPDGRMIAAVRLVHGGSSQVVILDTTGIVRRIVADERGSVSASPSWGPGGTTLWFTSDRTGTSEVWVASIPADDGAPAPLARVSDAVTAFSDPEPAAAGGRIAAVRLEADGMTLGSGVPAPADSARAAGSVPRPPTAPPPAPRDSSASHPYHAARQLVPRYWYPTVYTSDRALVLGAATSGSDVVGRHAYAASVEASTRRNEQGGGFGYAWAGLGRPVVQLGASQGWDGAGLIVRPNGDVAGTLRRRTRLVEAGLSATRPRTRSYLAASVAGGIELRDYTTDPGELLAALNGADYFRATHRRPFAFLGLGASNVQRPSRSISAEDGLTATVSGERLWDRDERRGAHTRAIGAIAGYRSLDLPGYAHHVLALRTAGGWTDSEDGSDLSVGGLSSETLGSGSLSLGGTRDFPVRGYSSGALSGTRAVSATLEYRAPLTLPATGLGFLYFDRTSLALFGDAATAWCGGPARTAGTCGGRDRPGTPIASVGAEWVVDLAIVYDSPLSLSVGYAQPVGALRRTELAARGLYIGLGHAF